jgi:hypothetical protein
MTDRDDLRVRKALQGMSFPAERQDVLDYVTDRGEQEQRTLNALRALPDRVFSNVDDVVISVPQSVDQA